MIEPEQEGAGVVEPEQEGDNKAVIEPEQEGANKAVVKPEQEGDNKAVFRTWTGRCQSTEVLVHHSSKMELIILSHFKNILFIKSKNILHFFGNHSGLRYHLILFKFFELGGGGGDVNFECCQSSAKWTIRIISMILGLNWNITEIYN